MKLRIKLRIKLHINLHIKLHSYGSLPNIPTNGLKWVWTHSQINYTVTQSQEVGSPDSGPLNLNTYGHVHFDVATSVGPWRSSKGFLIVL